MNTAVAIVSVVAEDDEEGGTREELLLLISNEPGKTVSETFLSKKSFLI